MINVMPEEYSCYFHEFKFNLYSIYYLIILQEINVTERA